MISYLKNVFIRVLFFYVLTFDVFAADKPIVAIGEITSNVGGNTTSFQTMLETAISQTNKFELMERSRMDEILGEQALSTGEISGLNGVDYLVYGSITKLGKKSSGLAIGGIAAGGKGSEMAVDIRVVDASSGSIRISKTVEKEAKGGTAFAMEGFATAQEEADPLGAVQRLTANAVAALIAIEIFPIKVINVSKGQAYVNYGPPSVTDGTVLKIIELGEGFMDPDTGEMLGQDETYVGAVEITDAKSKFSIGKILEGDIKRGAIASIIDRKEAKSFKRDIKKREKARLKKCKKEKNC
jgi:curli biogenesis system outer membrane secretion channel CsgG